MAFRLQSPASRMPRALMQRCSRMQFLWCGIRSRHGTVSNTSLRRVVPTASTQVYRNTLTVLVPDEGTDRRAVETVGVVALIEIAHRGLQARSRQILRVDADLTAAHLAFEERAWR